MGHLLKIKCVGSRVNVNILASTSVPFDGASAKFSTNSQEMDNSVPYVCEGHMETSSEEISLLYLALPTWGEGMGKGSNGGGGGR
jgi:hypothetical protein